MQRFIFGLIVGCLLTASGATIWYKSQDYPPPQPNGERTWNDVVALYKKMRDEGGARYLDSYIWIHDGRVEVRIRNGDMDFKAESLIDPWNAVERLRAQSTALAERLKP